MTHWHPEDTLAKAKLAAFINESATSGSKYKEPEGGDDEPEMEEETYANADLENNEPDTSIRIKKGGKKQKKGIATWDEISVAVATLSDNLSPFAVATSRVGSRGKKTLG